MLSPLRNTKWKLILTVDLLLALLLCLGILTRYSWNNEWGNLVFPPIVGFIGIAILVFKKKIVVFGKWIDAIFFTPSLLVGGPYILQIILLISVSLFFWPNIFIEEKIAGTIIQQESAPSNTKFVQVECFPSAGHNGHWIKIDVIYQAVPFAKRELLQFFEGATCDKINNGNYISWVDNNTIYLLKSKEEINVTLIGWNNLFKSNLEK